MRWKWVSVLIFTLTGFQSHSQAPSSQAELHEVVKKIERAQTALNPSTSRCETSTSTEVPSCTFENYCGNLHAKSQDLYLFRDSEGHQLQNLLMVKYLEEVNSTETAKSCLPPLFDQFLRADPFVNPRLLFDEKLAGGRKKMREHHERVQKGLTRTQKIVTDVQNRLVQFLRDRKTPSNAREMDNLIARVRAIQFQTPPLDKTMAELEAYGCSSANAYFEFNENAIRVCPQMMNFPEATLFSILAHELGHAIDSCVTSFDFSATGRIPAEWMGYEKSQEPIKISSIPLAKHPFKDTLRCLQSPDSIGARIPSLKDMIGNIDKEFEMAKKNYEAAGISMSAEEQAQAKTNFKEQKEQIKKNYKNFQHCKEFSKSADLQESFGDWISSEMVAEKLANISDSKKAKEFAFMSMALFYSNDCDNIRQSVLSKFSASAKKGCHFEFDADATKKANDAMTEIDHPTSARRINRVLYAHPAIQKALGCRPLDNGRECGKVRPSF